MYGRVGKMMKRRFITARDLKNWADELDDGDLDLPVAVSEKTCGMTNDYFNVVMK